MSRYDEPRACGCRGDDQCCKSCDPGRLHQALQERIVANLAKAAAAKVGGGKYNKARDAAKKHRRNGGRPDGDGSQGG